MDLVLWRHAEAVEPAPGTLDMGRVLTRRGEKQAAKMSAWLDRQLPETARIWSSPARRTEQTALALGRKFKVSDALAPQASAEDLLELVQWPSGSGCVVVIGHQPTLGQTLSQLLGVTEQECAVRKGALWWLRFRQREDGGQTVVVTVQSPDFL